MKWLFFQNVPARKHGAERRRRSSGSAASGGFPVFDRRRIIRLYVPVLIEQALATFITMFGTVMVSGVSASAVSGVGLVDSINMLVISVFTAIATGVTVMVSQYIGAGDHTLAGKAAGQSLVVCVEAAAVAGVLLALFARPMLRALFGHAEQPVLDAALTYLMASSISMPLQALYATSTGIMRAAGDSRTPMFASLLSDIAYIAVASLCIYTLHMGVLGAGLGLAASRLVSSGIAFTLLIRGHGAVVVPRLSLKPDWKVLAPVLNIAVPAGADSGLFNGGKIIVQVFMSGMGTAALAANSIVNALCNILNLPGSAMSILSMTVVGQCYGARMIKSTRRYMLRLTLVSMALLAAACVLMLLGLDPLIALFHPLEESVPISRLIMVMMFISTPLLWSSAFVTPSMLRATGDVKFPMVISVLSMFVLRVAGAWFFGVHLGWGLPGIWFSMVVDWLGRSAFYVPRMLSGAWCKEYRQRVEEEERADASPPG